MIEAIQVLGIFLAKKKPETFGSGLSYQMEDARAPMKSESREARAHQVLLVLQRVC